MFESLRTWATPYGGDLFLYLLLLAVLSFAGLLWCKQRLQVFTLKRCIRMAAVIALPLSVLAMEMGPNHWGIAAVAVVWCVVVGLTCKNEVTRRQAQSL